jgi:hypothetical protein
MRPDGRVTDKKESPRAQFRDKYARVRGLSAEAVFAQETAFWEVRCTCFRDSSARFGIQVLAISLISVAASAVAGWHCPTTTLPRQCFLHYGRQRFRSVRADSAEKIGRPPDRHAASAVPSPAPSLCAAHRAHNIPSRCLLDHLRQLLYPLINGDLL